MRLKQNRAAGFAAITLIYILAGALALYCFALLGGRHIFVRVLVADLAATLLIYLVGLLLGNASVYDPYWSVAPVFITVALALHYGHFGPAVVLLLVVVGYWGVRLTFNWAVTFHHLGRQDWRYDMFKQRFPRLYPLISLFGIHLMPTLIVYLALLPAIALIEANPSLHPAMFAGAAVCVGAATLQLVADIQMHRFNRESANRDSLIRVGLWKYARHPNYLGEILMWWGVYLIMLPALPGSWQLGVGALANTLLFLIVSIPMADKRNAQKRKNYAEYRAATRSLLPIPRGGR